MLSRLRKDPKMPIHDESFRYPQDEPPRRDLDRPLMRRDPEVEAAMVSATAMLDLKRRVAQLETDLSAKTAECETWRARAEAKQELIDATAVELRRHQGFVHGMIGKVDAVSNILVDIIKGSREMSERFNSLEQVGTPDNGQQVPGFLKPEDLAEEQSK